MSTWTTDGPAEMRRLSEAGVDGIATNKPDLLARVLAAVGHGAERGS